MINIHFPKKSVCILYTKNCIFAGQKKSDMIEIKEVVGKKAIRAFLDFPDRLYKDCPHYVPPLRNGELKIMTRHPALAFCEAKYWLALRDGEVVGRVGGVINRSCNELKGQKRVRFGWFDVVEDLSVAKALLDTVEQWGRAQGMTEISGPSRFSNMEKQAMLIEGFDFTPSIASDYNYPYYPQFMDALGFEKEVDYIQYKVPVKEIPDRIKQLSSLLSEKYHVHLRKFPHKEDLKRSGKEFFHALNRSYADLYNFIPLTEEEIDWAVDENFQVASVDLSSMLEDDEGRLVGFAFCLPSLSEAYRKAKGRLFPFGWMHILHALRHNQYVDMYLTGVLPEYHNSGIHVIYHQQLHEAFLKAGFTYAFSSQQLENNTAARIWPKYGGQLVARRRCYKKTIG